MQDLSYIKTRLDNIRANACGQEIENIYPRERVTQLLEWVYNNGNGRTQTELDTKLTSLKEELLTAELTGDRSYIYKASNDCVNELQLILND